MWEYNHPNELYHFGVKGQKWGVRRYQNANGSLTPAGLKRYSDANGVVKKSVQKKVEKAQTKYNAKQERIKIKSEKKIVKFKKRLSTAEEELTNLEEEFKRNSSNIEARRNGRLKDSDSARNLAEYQITKTRIDWDIARNKASIDPNYKNSKAYKKAKDAYTTDFVNELTYGEAGKVRVQQLRNLGKTETQADSQYKSEKALSDFLNDFSNRTDFVVKR